MWERFELFWTAFEKFALFFAFLGTLVCLVMLTLIYSTLTQASAELAAPPTPTPTPPPAPPVGDVIHVVLDGFSKIQGAVSPVNVPISHTVPIVLEVRIDSDLTKLEMVGKNEIRASDIAIRFPDDVGWLVGEEALLKPKDGEILKVKMDVRDEVRFTVPIRVDVPVQVPSGVDLQPEMAALWAISTTWGSAPAAVPQPGSGPP